MSDSASKSETETEEHRELSDYHCVAHADTRPSPNHGEVTHAYFDEGVLDSWVYAELLEAIRADGYELLAFGTTTIEEAEDVDTEGVGVSTPKAVFVYRGIPAAEE